MTSGELIKTLELTAGELNLGFVHYESPNDLIQSDQDHEKDVVLTLYGGKDSRNRMLLTPAVCESMNLRFVGADTYARAISQDKYLSKIIATDFGIATPPCVLLRTINDLGLLNTIKLPLVIKPNMEGSSIGISDKSLVTTLREAIEVASELLAYFESPIIAEEFVGGSEVSYCWIKSPSGMHWGLVDTVIDQAPLFFNSGLFDANLKRQVGGKSRVLINHLIDAETRRKFDAYVEAIGTISYGRLDGKLKDGVFYFLELTPDAYLKPGATFAATFSQQNWPYSKIIDEILLSAC
jgi:D-alanine-D-alanine ligase